MTSSNLKSKDELVHYLKTIQDDASLNETEKLNECFEALGQSDLPTARLVSVLLPKLREAFKAWTDKCSGKERGFTVADAVEAITNATSIALMEQLLTMVSNQKRFKELSSLAMILMIDELTQSQAIAIKLFDKKKGENK